jgi:DNA-binding NtrC family response regulator
MLSLPALRERGNDVVELAQILLERTCARLHRSEPAWSETALQVIRDYPWPGNVRELENAIERAVIVHEGGTLAAEDLGIELSRARVASPIPQVDDATTLEDYFVRFVTEHEDTLTETELAQKLGISRKSLWERRQRLNIPRRRTHKRGPRRDG